MLLSCKRRLCKDVGARTETGSVQMRVAMCRLQREALKNPHVPDLADSRRALQDQIGDVFGHQCAGHVVRDICDELRRYVNNERVGIAFEAVFVADSVVHGGGSVLQRDPRVLTSLDKVCRAGRTCAAQTPEAVRLRLSPSARHCRSDQSADLSCK